MESIKNERAASLIEAMIALLIFLIASVGWLALESSLAQQSGQSHLISQAVFVGQSAIDNLRQMPFDQVDSQGSALYFTSGGKLSETADDDFFAVTWEVTETDAPVSKNINVNVTWDVYSDDFDNSIELNFVRSQ